MKAILIESLLITECVFFWTVVLLVGSVIVCGLVLVRRRRLLLRAGGLRLEYFPRLRSFRCP